MINGLKGTWLLIVEPRSDDSEGEVLAAFKITEELPMEWPAQCMEHFLDVGAKEDLFVCEWDGDVPDLVENASWVKGQNELTDLIPRLTFDECTHRWEPKAKQVKP